MKKIFAVLIVSVLSLPVIYAEYPNNKAKIISTDCKVTGGLFVDTLFRAVPSVSIGIDSAHQKSKPAVLDRINGYMKLSYENKESGFTYTYTAAMYTGGPDNSRIFLMITKDESTVSNFPSTESFWIFEYSKDRCSDLTGVIAPNRGSGGIVRLPQNGTDLESCIMKGDENGLREICTKYIWDLKAARFIKMK